jgi:hypothetical protein
MIVNYRQGVSIFQLLVYVPILFITVILTSCYGFRKTAGGWMFMVLFALLRIVGACCYVATITRQKPALFVTTLLCNSYGVAVLIIAYAVLLKHV